MSTSQPTTTSRAFDAAALPDGLIVRQSGVQAWDE